MRDTELFVIVTPGLLLLLLHEHGVFFLASGEAVHSPGPVEL